MNTIECVVTVLLMISNCSFAATRKDVQQIDSWVASPPLILFSVENDSNYQFQCSQSDSGIFGGERDIRLDIDPASDAGRVLSTSVNGAEFNLATPTTITGKVLVQYDGDDCSDEINTNGLNNADLTYKNGDSFRIVAASDHDIDITIRVYAPDGSMASATITVVELENIAPQEFYIPFSSFTGGNVNFKNIGAVELYIDVEENVDLTINTFAIAGFTRVLLIAPVTVNQCDFTKGCCNDIEAKFPQVISTTSSPPSSSSSESSDINNNPPFDFYDDYFTAHTVSSASTLGSVLVVISCLLLLL